MKTYNKYNKTKKNKTKKNKTKKKKKQIVIKDTTPIINKKMKDITESYNPSINVALTPLKTRLSKISILFPNIEKKSENICKNREVNVVIGGKNKCLNWRNKKVKDVMLDKLLSKSPINCKEITAPKQLSSNCWFNSFFMTMFISDKGRKFNRYFRRIMITGKMPVRKENSEFSVEKKSIDKDLKWSFFLLNMYIEASLRGKNDPQRFAELMDTNNLIGEIYNSINKKKKHFKLTEKNTAGNMLEKTISVPGVDEAANPYYFYVSIINYLYNKEIQNQKIPILFINFQDIPLKGIKKDLSNKIKAPHILFIEYTDENSKMKKPTTFSFKNKNGEKIKYKLDSAILRNIGGYHFSAYLTCNKKDYGFDGASFKRIEPFNWKSKINKNIKWRFADEYPIYFNFTQGYQILIYYRI